MKGPPIDQTVYGYMFPKPKAADPQNFQGLLQRQLVPEVRLETQAFYGHLASQEAKYPGLDYSYTPHRLRLSRYPWHHRLFRAFDKLGLTASEIASLTKWEGTRWAKERYEREQGIVIRDTTGDGIEDWIEPEMRTAQTPHAQRADVEDMEDIQEDDAEEENNMDEDGEDSDAEIRSVGIELNERLRAAVAQREAGNATTVMDEEWEQWLKDAVEAGGLPFLSSDLGLSPDANIPGTRPAMHSPTTHSRLLNIARLGQWQQIPDVLHNVTRQRVESSQSAPSPSPPTLSNTSTAPFLSRSRPAPRARAIPSTSSHDGRTNLGSTARRNPHLPDQFSRRPIPSIPSSTSRPGTTSVWNRTHARPSQQQNSTS